MTVTAISAHLGKLQYKRWRFQQAAVLIIALFIAAGFSFEIDRYFIHPNAHRPAILFVHAIVFSAWMVLYVTQTLLIPARKYVWHRNLGWFGCGLAIIMPPLGLATALVMRKFDLQNFPSTNFPRDLSFLATTLADLIAFTPCAWLGIWLRKRPDYHGRLMYLSIASIAEAGFGRLPVPGMLTWFFLGNFVFLFSAVAYDKVTRGKVHPVYRWGVPLIMADECIAMLLWLGHPLWWQALVRGWIGLP